MEWVGFIALAIMLCYAAYPGKVNRLETKVKRIERKIGGESSMSKLINDLVGSSCKIKSDEALALVGGTEIDCTVLDADDEWIKVTYVDKKGNTKTKILRIETIESVELSE